MSSAILSIDLDAIVANWRALDALSGPATATAAVVKADGYALGAARVAGSLADAGARVFCVALAEEGAALRTALGPGPEIMVFGGHMAGDAALLRDHGLIPMLNSPQQLARHREALPGAAFGIQLDSGMKRLGFEPGDWAEARQALPGKPRLIMSHLACADEPDHPQNRRQFAAFRSMTDGLDAPRSLSATGGILLGPDYHFDLTRPGIGLYGGLPFAQARPVVRLSIPVIQCREVLPGESVGYGATWTAGDPARVATISAGYADGLFRSLSNRTQVFAGDVPCPVVGRVSMDLIGVDVTALEDDPESVDILGPHQGVDALAQDAGTIGYEILTALGQRYRRVYSGGRA